MKYYKNNVLGSLILFEEMEKAGVNNIVFSFWFCSWNLQCYKSSKKDAGKQGIKYGNKPDASVQCLQNWT